MWLTRTFIERPTLIFVAVAATIIVGFLALRSLVVQEMPNTSLPSVNVAITYSGASTTELRDAIVKPIEDQLAGTPQLEHIDSTIQTGSATITASFALQSSASENLTNVQRALQAAQAQLPLDLTAPTIRSANPSEAVVVSLALTSKTYDSSALAQLAQNAIAPAIEQVPGISNVAIKGQTQRAFAVEVDPSLLAAANLTLTDIVSAIAGNNVRAPGGIVYGRGRETQLDVRGDIIDPAALAALPVSAGAPVMSATAAGAGSSGGSTGGSAAAGTGSSTSTAGAATPSYTGATGPGTAVVTSPALSFPSGPPAASATTGGYPIAPAPLSSASASESALQNANGTGAQSNLAGSGTPSTAAANGGPAAAAAAPATGSASATTSTATSSNPAPSSNTGAGSNTATASSASSATSSTNTATAANPATSASNASTTGGTAFGATARATVSNDQAVALGATSPGSATMSSTSTQAAPATVSVPNTASGQSGVATSPYVGTLEPWAIPASDKRIGDVARVRAGSVPVRVFTTVDGKTGIGLDIQKASDASEVTVSDRVLALLPALRARFPGVSFGVEHVQATYTREQLDGVERTLFEGIALTALVMLFFLRSWRNAVVVMIAIPTSLGVTLYVMSALGLTLDTISLLAMTLIIGLLVDDSTVVLENIERHHANGEAGPEAALNGRTEIGTAALVITLVDVVVFLPIAFASGPVGRQLSEFGIVVSIATLTSLAVSFTITPALAGLWSLESGWKPWPIVDRFTAGLEAVRTWYSERLLPAVLRRPLPIVAFALIATVGAGFLVPLGIVGEEYTPAGDQGEIFVQATFAAGTPLAHVRAASNRMEKHVIAIGDDLEAEETSAGGYDAAFGGFVQEGNVAQSHIWLRAAAKTPTAVWVQRLHDEAVREMPDAAIVVKPASAQSGGPKQPIDELVELADGGDPSDAAKRVEAALRSTPGAINVQDSATNVTPQMAVEFDRDMARALDVSIGTAASAIRAAYGGTQATQIETSAGLVEIEVIYPRSEQTRLSDVLRIPIRAQNGSLVHVGDIAHLRYAPASLLITREDRADVVHISANVAANAQLSNVAAAFAQRVAALKLPKNVVLRPAAQGQQDLMGQTLAVLGASLALSFVFVLLLMVALYDSFRTPLAIVFAIPLAVVGALGALAVTHQTLNLYSLIGTVLLVGLVTKNGILLVDFADRLRERGATKIDAIRQSAATRFRPILMTTLAMVAGMLPLALGLDPGASTRKSLGIVVIGGLTSSLVLTLAIVPIAYLWIAPREARRRHRFARPDSGASPATLGNA